MAVPRVFLSSTCYDLQEIRLQLRNFIKDFGYDCALSEFDDIFYSPNIHVQDSCINEIEKCQMFILIIGNNYGSVYHLERKRDNVPDSVTLKEFKKALELNIHKHIFINRFVEYDYRNYKRALERKILQHFTANNVPDERIEEIRSSIKLDFDQTFPFAYESYRYVFYFLDIINDLQEGNAIHPFETYIQIQDTLKKQWAGFMYESLTKRSKVSISALRPLEFKLNEIEKSISILVASKTDEGNHRISFDLTNLVQEVNHENLEKTQKRIAQLLNTLFLYPTGEHDYEGDEIHSVRFEFEEQFNGEKTKLWLESLGAVIQNYKWSNVIHAGNLFPGVKIRKYNDYMADIPYKTIMELFTIYSSLDENDKLSFVNTICQKFNRYYYEPVVQNMIPITENVDDLPF
jgi:hypothetical protein